MTLVNSDAVDERPVPGADVSDHQHAVDFVDLAMAAADAAVRNLNVSIVAPPDDRW